MCSTACPTAPVSDNWLGGFYDVYPVTESFPALSEKWGSADLKTIKQVFPRHLEAYCVIALIAASVERMEWAGATYDYLDRLAIGGLRREHGRSAWQRLGKWLLSLGATPGLTRTDALILLTQNFVSVFWRSMNDLVADGCVRVEQREIDYVSVDVFFPTARLVNRMNCSLAK